MKYLTINNHFFWNNMQIFPTESLQITSRTEKLDTGDVIVAKLGNLPIVIDDRLENNTIKLYETI